jgi:hypothetical protein
MSSAEIIALVCVLCLVPVWAAGSIIMFALGAVRCGRMMDPYHEDGSGGERGRCPLGPHGPRDDGDRNDPQDVPGRDDADWWPQFERDLGRYVEQQECPSGRDPVSADPGTEAGGTPTRA